MFTTTFYSYKGGVGRTTALINTAYRLIARRKRVFLLDFDLEAPGMDLFFPGQARNQPGLVEYISEYTDTGTVPPLGRFVSEIPLLGSSARRMYYMRAGRGDPHYQTLLAHLNWKEFYARSQGFFVVENLKGAIEADYSPDYLLIDSRTGLTDVSGVCTLQLPNLVVLMFALNEQNLQGTRTIYRSIIRNQLSRAIETKLVASPVPDVPTFVELREKRLSRAKEYLEREVDLILPYAGFLAFEEAVLPAENAGTFLAQQYDQLANIVIESNKSDVLTLLKAARDLAIKGDPEQADRKYQEITQAYQNLPRVWRDYGIFLRGTREPEKALRAFERALEHGGSEVNLAQLALTYLVMGNQEQAQQKFHEFLKTSSNINETKRFSDLFASRNQIRMAIAGYERLVELLAKEDNPSRLGAMLINLGDLCMRDKQPERALTWFRRVLKTDPHSLPGNYNAGYALALIGRIEEAQEYFAASVAAFTQMSTQAVEPASRANIMQAMGQAYAAMGDIQRAQECYTSALQLAEGLPNSRIFSSVQYREVATEEFKSETKRLLEQVAQTTREAT